MYGPVFPGEASNDTIHASGLTVPLTAYAGSGTDTIIGGQANNEIYGGSGFDTLDGTNGQNNWIQAGSGGAEKGEKSNIKGGNWCIADISD